jgi:hypothetical protein
VVCHKVLSQYFLEGTKETMKTINQASQIWPEFELGMFQMFSEYGVGKNLRTGTEKETCLEILY